MAATFRIITFGCKVNQYESRQICELLERMGLAEAAGDEESIDLAVINTCVVTGAAGRQCRQMIRRWRRQWPDSRIVVTGCYATGPEAGEVAAMEAADAIVGDKADLLARLPDLVMQWFPQSDASCSCGRKRAVISAAPADGGLEHFAGHARAFVKIQDGCDQFCTYCIVPHVRSRIWSRSPADVVAEVQRLVESGHREIVLSGIHLGRYRHEVGDREALPRLIEQLLAAAGPMRLRLSSIEVGEVTDRLVDLMAAHPDRLCPHLHIPLQSGDDEVLAAMRRPYSAADFVKRVEDIRRTLPDVAFSSDVIVGFPGESDAAFDRTRSVVEHLGFSRLHVFPYSPRPNTPAASMAGQIDPQTRQQRAARLRALGDALARRYAGTLVGRRVAVLVEELREAGGTETSPQAQLTASGFDEHYVRVQAEVMSGQGGDVGYGHLLPVKIVGQGEGCLLARADGNGE